MNEVFQMFFWALLFRFRCFGLASESVDVLETDVTFHVGSGDGGRYGHGCRCMCFCFVAAWCILKEGLKCLPYSGNPRLSSGSWWLSFHVATFLEVILLTHRKTAVEEENAMYQKVNCSLSCYFFTSRVSVLLNVIAISLLALYGQVCSFMNLFTYLYIYIYIYMCMMLCCHDMYYFVGDWATCWKDSGFVPELDRTLHILIIWQCNTWESSTNGLKSGFL